MRTTNNSSMMLCGLAVVLASTATGACTPVTRPDRGTGLLSAGDMAPEVIGTTRDGKPATLSQSRGHAAVVYFYPKDETPGCTKEACAFRDAFTRYEDRHVTIFGISRDSAERHKEFRTKYKLQFPLVADEDGSVSRAYGVSSTFGMASRVTFLVGKDGRVVRVWPDVDPGIHADEVFAAAVAAEDAKTAAIAPKP